ISSDGCSISSKGCDLSCSARCSTTFYITERHFSTDQGLSIPEHTINIEPCLKSAPVDRLYKNRGWINPGIGAGFASLRKFGNTDIHRAKIYRLAVADAYVAGPKAACR